jgi:predicted enzyme related to lactoylglutathione lyase
MARPVHFEIHSRDPEAGKAFYSTVFGWTIDRWGDVPYWLATTGGGPGIDGALAPPQDHGQKVVLTMEVDDLAATLDRVREAGGTVVMEASPIPGVGTLAQAFDPNGVLFSMLEPPPGE